MHLLKVPALQLFWVDLDPGVQKIIGLHAAHSAKDVPPYLLICLVQAIEHLFDFMAL
jgi:hypothetical protein